MILLANSGDQRSAKKVMIEMGKTCGMFQDEHETENGKEQVVDGDERYVRLVVACLKMENSIKQVHDKKRLVCYFKQVFP